MCQGYTLQEDHVWWPARSKLHGKVSPILEMGCGWNSIGHFGNVPSALRVGKQHEWDGMDYVSKTCVNMKCKKNLGWKTEGLSTQRREPPFLLNEGTLHRQMDKCYVILAKNMHVKLLNSICRTCFDFISIMTNCLSMNRAYMAHIEKGCTLSRCGSWKGFQYWLHPGEWMHSRCLNTW